MTRNKIAHWQTPHRFHKLNQKLRELLHHPFTFIVLVWMMLWLAFYLVTTFL